MTRVAMMLAALLMLPALSRGGPDEQWRTTAASLKGIDGVYIVVRYDAPTEAQEGLSEQDLRSALALRLQANDIRLLSEQEWARSPRRPYLCLTVTGTRLTDGTKDPDYLFAWGLDLIQRVSTLEERTTEVPAITWTQEYSAVLPEHALRDVTVKVSDLALEFATAVQAAEKGAK